MSIDTPGLHINLPLNNQDSRETANRVKGKQLDDEPGGGSGSGGCGSASDGD